MFRVIVAELFVLAWSMEHYAITALRRRPSPQKQGHILKWGSGAVIPVRRFLNQTGGSLYTKERQRI
jgi:hypothetical protein